MPVATKTGLKWRMEAPCSDCPFSDSVDGRFLRETLGPRRVEGIERDLLKGAYFTCHKTTREEGWNDEQTAYNPVGPELVCAGAITWQSERDIVADLVQVMERMEIIRGRAK